MHFGKHIGCTQGSPCRRQDPSEDLPPAAPAPSFPQLMSIFATTALPQGPRKALPFLVSSLINERSSGFKGLNST